jgi:hypothetical protein
VIRYASAAALLLILAAPQADAGSNASIAVHIIGLPSVTGSHSAIFGLAEDAYQGDAQYSLSVDGAVVSKGTITVLESSGNSQNIPVDLVAGSHTIVVTFLNDAYGGTPALDRNLYVNHVSYDGVAITGGLPAALLNTGAAFTISLGSPLPPDAVIIFAPVSPITIPDTTPLGAHLAAYSVQKSDGSPFTGTVGFAMPYGDGGGLCALQPTDNAHGFLIVNPAGPGIGPVTVPVTDNCSLVAQ